MLIIFFDKINTYNKLRGITMAYLKRYGGQIILEINNSCIREWAGLIKYKIDGNRVCDFYGRCLYEIDGDRIKEWAGFYVLEVKGNNIKRYGGQIIAQIDGNKIKEWAGLYIYEISGFVSHKELMALIAILFA